MKLELKHIAPYLPYELKYKVGNIENGTYELIDLGVLYIQLMSDIENEEVLIRNIDDESIKPILRQLSDLTKDDKFTQLINEELICGAWKFVHDDWTTSIQTSNNQHTLLIIQNEVAPECTVLFFNYMIENHYDVFGLIEQGLAISCNDL